MRLLLLAAFCALFSGVTAAQANSQCQFGFEIDTQSSGIGEVTVDGERKVGFWLSINRAPRKLRDVAQFIGRMQVCLETPDGAPAIIRRGGREFKVASPFVTSCTVALLPGNRLLTNSHCYYEPSFVQAGFTIVKEARVNFNYTSRDDIGAVRTYPVSTQELQRDVGLDAMLLQISDGNANRDLGGHFPMKMMSQTEPLQELRMIHHPSGDPQQYSTGTCQVHRRQGEISADRSPFRHTCESIGGSSGSLILDAETLAIVALHNQGGLSRLGDSFNGAHKIAMIDRAFGLGLKETLSAQDGPPPAAEPPGNSALTDALLLPDRITRMAALKEVSTVFGGTEAGNTAKTLLLRLQNDQADASKAAQAATPDRALSAAMLIFDRADQVTALQAIAKTYPDSTAAQTVKVLLKRFEQEDKAQKELRAKAALSEVLSFDDQAQQMAILTHVVAAHAGTQAAKKAQGLIDQIRGGGGLSLSALKERIDGPVEIEQFGVTVKAETTAIKVCDKASFTVQTSQACLLDVIYPDTRAGKFFRLSEAAIGDPILKPGEVRQIPQPGRELQSHTPADAVNLAVNCYPDLTSYDQLGVDLLQRLEDYNRAVTKNFSEVVTDVTDNTYKEAPEGKLGRRAAPIATTITFSIAANPAALDENGRCKP